MIRNTLDPASQHGIVLITPTRRVAFHWRDQEMGVIRIMINSCAPLVILSAAKDLGCEREKRLIRWPDPSASPQDDRVPEARELFRMRLTRSVSSYRNRATLPHWVRLTRQGSRFTPQHSSDGATWEDVVDYQDPNEPKSIGIPMNETVHIGLAISSHNATRTAEARISNVRPTGSVSPPGPFAHSKDVSFDIPPDNSTNK
jgi:hypothetical protein